MKILIAAQGNNLDAKIDKRFGHSKFFIIFDTQAMDYKSIPNAVEGDAQVGLDIVIQEGIEAIITGNIGPNAFQKLQDIGIPVYVVRGVTVKEALAKIAGGELQPIDEPTMKKSVHDGHHFGQMNEDFYHTGHPEGWGYGRGWGRGMGHGRHSGRGMGRGRGRGRGRGMGHHHHED